MARRLALEHNCVITKAAMTDALSVKILAALDKQMYGKKGIDNLEEVYKDQQMEKGSDSSEWYRRRG